MDNVCSHIRNSRRNALIGRSLLFSKNREIPSMTGTDGKALLTEELRYLPSSNRLISSFPFLYRQISGTAKAS